MRDGLRKRRENDLTRIEYACIDEAEAKQLESTIGWFTEDVRDVLISFPVDDDKQFEETARMLLGIQTLYRRHLTAGEAGLILYSCFDPRTFESPQTQKPGAASDASSSDEPVRRPDGLLGRLFRRIFGKDSEV